MDACATGQRDKRRRKATQMDPDRVIGRMHNPPWATSGDPWADLFRKGKCNSRLSGLLHQNDMLTYLKWDRCLEWMDGGRTMYLVLACAVVRARSVCGHCVSRVLLMQLSRTCSHGRVAYGRGHWQQSKKRDGRKDSGCGRLPLTVRPRLPLHRASRGGRGARQQTRQIVQ